MVWQVEKGEAYALLARMAAETWGLSPLPALERLPGGKPWFPSHPRAQFSLSHSGPLALCALSDGPVGADIEEVRPRRESLPRYALSGEELAWFQSRGSRWEDFYTLWTLKEARVKCTGEGLKGRSRTIRVPLLESGETAQWEGFSFTALAGENWRGALCQKV